MTKPHSPAPGELPTLRQLNRATLIAALAAGAILVTTVLPAEYGADPTGIGGALGLKAMGEMKQADHAGEDAASQAAAVAQVQRAASGQAVEPGKPVKVSITLQPNEGREVKATMRAGETFTYEWSTDGPEVRFELHGEEAGAKDDAFTSYEKGTSAGASGKFQAPFDGTHGWYWRNRNTQPVTITVSAIGAFESFAPKP